MRLHRLVSAVLLAAALGTPGVAQTPNAAAIAGMDAAITGLEAAVSQLQAAGQDASQMKASIAQMKAQRAAMQAGRMPSAQGFAGGVSVSGQTAGQGGSGTVQLPGGGTVTGTGNGRDGAGTVTLPGGVQVQGSGTAQGGAATITLPGGYKIQAGGVESGGHAKMTGPGGVVFEAQGGASGGSVRMPGGFNFDGSSMPNEAQVQGWLQGMMSNQGKASGGQNPAGVGGPPNAEDIMNRMFSASLDGMTAGLATLTAFGQPTADIRQKIEALRPQAKTLDSLYAKIAKYSMEGKVPPEQLTDKFEALNELLEPKIDEISDLMDERADAMEETMHQGLQPLGAGGTADDMEALQKQMLELQKQTMEAFGGN